MQRYEFFLTYANLLINNFLLITLEIIFKKHLVVSKLFVSLHHTNQQTNTYGNSNNFKQSITSNFFA